MTVVLVPAARDDLRAVYVYYAERSPATADPVVGAILNAANALARFPLMGRSGVAPGTRERIVARYPYRIVYRVVDETETVEVLRILHGARPFQRPLYSTGPCRLVDTIVDSCVE